jgi:predicted lactoylglutathione lyase
MLESNWTRRRVLQIAGAAAVPGLLPGCVESGSSTAPVQGGASQAQPPAPATSSGTPEKLAKESGNDQEQPSTSQSQEQSMNLGAFSVSLAVKDLELSRQFYEKLGFKPFAGVAAQKWLILKNGDHVIGLFQGMFEKNIMTFNPGWDQNAQKLESFTDVRELQRQLKSQGVKPVTEADENTKGPASFMVVDPDGNTILFDQHV